MRQVPLKQFLGRSALIAQFGRYIDDYKDMSQVDFASEVMVPVFRLANNVDWVEYKVTAVVINFGARPTSGHYRALLRHGDRRGYSDDGVRATVAGLSAVHRRNAYMLFLVRASQE